MYITKISFIFVNLKHYAIQAFQNHVFFVMIDHSVHLYMNSWQTERLDIVNRFDHEFGSDNINLFSLELIGIKTRKMTFV